MQGGTQILGQGEIDDSRGIVVSRFFAERATLMERVRQSTDSPSQSVRPTASSTPAKLSCSNADHPADRGLLLAACPFALPSSWRARGQGERPSLNFRESFLLIPEAGSL